MDITRSISEMIVRDLQPLSVVEQDGFRRLVNTLDPSYRLPSRRFFMGENIPSMYEDCHAKVKKCIDAAETVVMTTDMWTSRATEAFITVTCHIIDENWKMQTYVLETSSFSERHSADNICSTLRRIAAEWGITDKIKAVVTDNGANMVAAVRKAGWTHYPCFAHTLNLVVKDSIKKLPGLLDIQQRCSAIVSFFHHSTHATEKLKEVQKQLKFPEHKLIQSVETRWNSVFYMFERLCEQKEAVTTVLCLLGKNSLCLSEEDWTIVGLSLNALRPFEEVTREISSEKHVSVSKVIPLVTLLMRATAHLEAQGSQLAAMLSEQCQHRFRGIEAIYSLGSSTYLDTRFKNFVFRDTTNVQTLKKRLIAEMQSLGQTSDPAPEPGINSAISTTTVPVATTSHNSAGTSPSPPAAKVGIWAEFDTQILATQQHRTAGTDAIIELRRYSEEKPIPRNGDPLLWWKMNETAFPILNKIARKQLGILATSVPAERIFSKAGQLVTQRRSAIKGKNVNMLLFLNKNL